MDPADRDNELIAHSASERAGLGKGQVMRIRWDAAAHKARLPQYEFPMFLIAEANRLTQSMDHVPAGLLLGPPRSFVAGSGIRPSDGHCTLVSESMRSLGRGKKTIRCPTAGRSLRGPVRVRDSGEPRLKPLLEHFGVCGCQRVLGSEFRCAQAAASSSDFMAAICSIRLSRRLADSCTPRTDLAEGPGSFPPPGAVRCAVASWPFDCLG